MDIRDAYYVGGAKYVMQGDYEVWPRAEFPCYFAPTGSTYNNNRVYFDLPTSANSVYRIKFRPLSDSISTTGILFGEYSEYSKQVRLTYNARTPRLAINGTALTGRTYTSEEWLTDKYWEFGNFYLKDLDTNEVLISGTTVGTIYDVQKRLNLGYCWVYEAEVWDNGVQIFDGVPSILGNGELLIYDKVGHRFYPTEYPNRISGYTCEDTDYSDNYFTIEALSAGTLTLRYDIEYNISGTWVTSDGSQISVAEGDKISLRGPNASDPFYMNGSRHMVSFPFNVYGNVLSLSDGASFTGHTASSGETFSFEYWFKDQPVVDASNLAFPVSGSCNYGYTFQNCGLLTAPPSVLTGDIVSCYRTYEGCTGITAGSQILTEGVSNMTNMYAGCTSLVTAYPIYARWIEDAGFAFNGCTSLTVPAEMPNLESVGNEGLQWMYKGCTSLERAPVLNNLVGGAGRDAFAYMFDGCSSLNYIEVYWDDDMMLTPQARYINDNWVRGVSNSGVFIYPCTTEWWDDKEGGRYGYPSGWDTFCVERPGYYNLTPVTAITQNPPAGDYVLYSPNYHACVTSGLTTAMGVSGPGELGVSGWTNDYAEFGVFQFEGSGTTMTMKLKGTSDYVRTLPHDGVTGIELRDFTYGAVGDNVYLDQFDHYGNLPLISLGIVYSGVQLAVGYYICVVKFSGGKYSYPSKPYAIRLNGYCGDPDGYFYLYRIEGRV